MSSRIFWIYIGIFFFVCVGVAHFVFQNYLYMRPCVQCIYVRYYMLIAGFGAVFATIFYRQILGFILGILAFVYGGICGIVESIRLNAIHNAITSANPFGIKGCLDRPNFELGIKWDEIFPSLFRATGQCGMDMPMPPLEVKFDPLQAYLIQIYQNGWYLLPNLKLVNMAQISVCIFGAALILGAVLLILRVKKVKNG